MPPPQKLHGRTLVPYLNERTLYQLPWGYRKDGKRFEEFKEWAKKELRPILNRMLQVSAEQDILVPRAVYG